MNDMDYISIGYIQVVERLLKLIKIYGVEGTEDLIKKVYANMDKIKKIMLSSLYEITGWKQSSYLSIHDKKLINFIKKQIQKG